MWKTRLLLCAIGLLAVVGRPPSTTAAPPPTTRPKVDETWRVVIYADKAAPTGEQFWEVAYGRLQAFLKNSEFNVTILPDGQLDSVLTDTVAQLGLLVDNAGDADAVAKAQARSRRFYEWRFRVDAPPFESISVPVASGEAYTITPAKSQIVPTDRGAVTSQAVSYQWDVRVPEAPALSADAASTTVTIKPADAKAATLRRQITISREPSAELKRLVRVRLFRISTANDQKRTPFLDVFKSQGLSPTSMSPTGDSGQPPVLFIPYSRIPLPIIVRSVQVTPWFQWSESVDPLWARTAKRLPNDRFGPEAGVTWTRCDRTDEATYRRDARQKVGADSRYFWRVTLMVAPENVKSPVLFCGRMPSGAMSVWVDDPDNGGVRALEPAELSGWTPAEYPPGFEAGGLR